MIFLDKITISYQKNLIEDSLLTIQDNKITCLIGESGSGKTSLLYLAGLLTVNQNVEYSFNDYNLDYNDKESLALIRRLKIGYVFQDNNILDNLSIEDNFNYIAHLCHIDCCKEKKIELLNTVQLDKPLDCPTSSLSGGEKQRLAIALALSKNPDLIILDEPTSALDKMTAIQIMEVLKDIAHRRQKMILIASHSKIVSKMSDCIYEIKDKKIVTKNQIFSTNRSSFNIVKNRISINFYSFYGKLHLKKQFRLFILIFLVLSCIVSACAISKKFADSYANYKLSKINNNEIEEIIISSNQEAYSSCFYHNVSSDIDENLIHKVIDQNPTIKSYMFYKEWLINNYDLDGIHYEKQAIIKPYKYKQELINKVYLEYQDESNDGIYISYQLIPNINVQYSTLNFTIEQQSLSFPISGISTAYDTNEISLNKDTPIIYIPYNKIHSFLTASSTCILYTSDKNSISKIITDTKKLDMTIGASSDYAGQTTLYKDAINKISNLITFFSYTLYFLAIVSIALIYFKMLSDRNYEIAILKANGMSNKEVAKLILFELLLHLSIIIITSSSLIFLLQQIVSFILKYRFLLLNIKTLLTLSILSTCTMIIPTFITLIIMLRNDPVKTLRN